MINTNNLFISDLSDKDGQFFDYNFIKKNSLHINIDFLDFHGLIQALATVIKLS